MGAGDDAGAGIVADVGVGAGGAGFTTGASTGADTGAETGPGPLHSLAWRGTPILPGIRP